MNAAKMPAREKPGCGMANHRLLICIAALGWILREMVR